MTVHHPLSGGISRQRSVITPSEAKSVASDKGCKLARQPPLFLEMKGWETCLTVTKLVG